MSAGSYIAKPAGGSVRALLDGRDSVQSTVRALTERCQAERIALVSPGETVRTAYRDGAMNPTQPNHTDPPITKPSPLSVDETVARFSEIVAGRGLKVFAVIDHSEEAKAVGLELRATRVVIFGSPEAGTPVMQAAPLAALDLPLKVLVWADGDQTKLSYTAPTTLAARYGLAEELADRLAGIDALTDAVVA